MLYQELKERLESGDVIATQGADAEEVLRPSLPGSQGEDVNSAIDSALRETGVAPLYSVAGCGERERPGRCERNR